ncbi:helix-turn-helix domain-containing protein [Actinotignum sp. GS-2025f]|uniref:helix-turn-helix domain-containing protein n=1 Tax=Actinotignum sp. GS-2025f TaxID=3427279 RepID=UPI003F45FDD2
MDRLSVIRERSRQQAHRRRQMLRELTAIRVNKGLTQEIVARRMCLDEEAVAELEEGITNPTIHALQLYAVVIGAGLFYTVKDLDAEEERSKHEHS